MVEPLLAIDRLSLDFLTPRGRVHALRDVSLRVERGEVVGLVGESGSGKSTLAAVAARLLPGNAEIVAGSVRFAGEDVLALSPEGLRALRGPKVAMVFQDPMGALNPVRSVAAQMIDVQHRDNARSRREKRAAAVGMLRRVGIPDPERRVDRYPHEFSGGMRQRVCIAMALLAGPELLIADEPTTALDATTEAQIVRLMQELRALVRGSILFVSHHLGLVAELCDRVVVMYAGEVVEAGPADALFSRPRHPYTQALLACDPARLARHDRQGSLPTIEGDVPSLVDPPAGCVFRPRCAHAFARCGAHPPLFPVGAEASARCFLLERG